jgi:hypothetical protein
MADVIQFSCPACDASLRLPLAQASQQAPCPCCDQEPAEAIPAPPAAAFPAQPSNSSSRADLVLSILLSSVLSLAIGYIMGNRSNWIVSRTPLVPFQKPNIEPLVSAPLATPELSPPELVPTPLEPKVDFVYPFKRSNFHSTVSSAIFRNREP